MKTVNGDRDKNLRPNTAGYSPYSGSPASQLALQMYVSTAHALNQLYIFPCFNLSVPVFLFKLHVFVSLYIHLHIVETEQKQKTILKQLQTCSRNALSYVGDVTGASQKSTSAAGFSLVQTEPFRKAARFFFFKIGAHPGTEEVMLESALHTPKFPKHALVSSRG